jgi:hypothetical protein
MKLKNQNKRLMERVVRKKNLDDKNHPIILAIEKCASIKKLLKMQVKILSLRKRQSKLKVIYLSKYINTYHIPLHDVYKLMLHQHQFIGVNILLFHYQHKCWRRNT